MSISKSKLNCPPKNVKEVEWTEICGGEDCFCFESKKQNISDYLELQRELWTSLNIPNPNNRSASKRREGSGNSNSKSKQKSKSNLTMTLKRGVQRQMRGYDEGTRQLNKFPSILYYQDRCIHMRSRSGGGIPVPRIIGRCLKDFQNMGNMGIKKVIALVFLYLLLTTVALVLLLPMLLTKENLEYRFVHAPEAPKFLLDAMLWIQSQVKFFPVRGMGFDTLDSTAHAHWQYIPFFKSWSWYKQLAKTKLWLSFQSG